MHEPATPLAPSWGRRLAGIEGLRGIAAVSVLFYHLGLAATYKVLVGPIGTVLTLFNQGLTLFFVLSGFLLFRPFAVSILASGSLPSLKRYASNRLLRIYPAYVVAFAFTALLVGAAFIKGSTHGLGPDNVGRLTDPLQIFANLLLAQMFIPQYVMTGLPVSWTLTAEITFYLVLPLMALSAMGIAKASKNTRFAAWLWPVVMVLLGLGLTLWAHSATQGLSPQAAGDFGFGQTWSAVLLRSLLGQADLFGYGMIAALVVTLMHESHVFRISTSIKVSLLGAAAGVEILGFSVASPLLTNLSGVAAALVLLAVVLPSSRGAGINRGATVLEWLPIRLAGLMSYSIYLWHLPVILWLITHHLMVGDNARSMPLNGLLVLAMTAPLAALSYYFVERPAMRRKKPIGKPDENQPRDGLTHDVRTARADSSNSELAEVESKGRG